MAGKEKKQEVKNYGEQLAEEFGISDLKFAVIQKILGIAPNIYIITVDSKVEKAPIPIKKLKKATTSGTKLLKHRKPMILSFTPFVMQDTLFMGDPSLSIPVKLKDFTSKIEVGSVVFFRDLIGDYHFQKSKYD